MLRPACLAAGICIAMTASAEPSVLSGKAIEELISGSIIELHTPLGTRLPVYYSKQGQLTGHARSLASYLGSSSDTGRWWIAASQLCHKWDRWFSGETQCLQLSRQGATLHWRRQDGTTGTASIASQDAHTVIAQESPPVVKDAPRGPGAITPSFLALAQAREAQARNGQARETVRDTPPGPAGVSPMATTSAETRTQPRPSGSIPLPPVQRAFAAPSANAAPAKVVTTPPAAVHPQIAIRRDAAPPASPTFKVANIESSDVLNVREGPSADHPAVGSLAPIVRGVRIVGACRSLWCPVTHGDLSGWVNRRFLESESEGDSSPQAKGGPTNDAGSPRRDSAEAPRACLTPQARELLERIEARFGPVEILSTCRRGATIAGTGRPSRHASGNAVDFNAGARKSAIVEWLIANHHAGGTMTYAGMDHVHVDIGPHFVSLDSGGRRASRWRSASRD